MRKTRWTGIPGERRLSAGPGRRISRSFSASATTCHWCHVMARESFEDPETAQRLNSWFVSIKVDREERPDLDSVYMAVC